MLASVLRLALTLAPPHDHAPSYALHHMTRHQPFAYEMMCEQEGPPGRRPTGAPMPAADNDADNWFQTRELVRQGRVAAAVEEFSRQSTCCLYPPPASVVVGVLRCAALKGDLRAERQAYKIWADTWRSSAQLAPSELQAVEEGRAVAVSASGDVAVAAYRLHRLTHADLLPVRHDKLLAVAKQITAIAKELAPSSSRRPRRALRRLGGVELMPGCLCCQPTAGGADARAEAARTIAALASSPEVSTASAIASEEGGTNTKTAAELAMAVEEMLEQVGATLKMEIGTHVEVQRASTGTNHDWQAGVIKATWWRDADWPWEQMAAPYLVRLEKDGELIPAGIGFRPVKYVRAEE